MCEDSQGQSCRSTIITMVLFWERSWACKLLQMALLKPPAAPVLRAANNLTWAFISLCLIHCLVAQVLWQHFRCQTLERRDCVGSFKFHVKLPAVGISTAGASNFWELFCPPQENVRRCKWIVKVLPQSRLKSFNQIPLNLAKQLIKSSF